MSSKAELAHVAYVMNSLYTWYGASDETPADIYVVEPDPGMHDGITLEQLMAAMKTVDDLRVAASIGSGIIKITP